MEGGPDPIFVEKAVDLADRLLAAFETPAHLPTSMINLAKREGVPDADNRGLASTAEVATLQLELRYLSWLTEEDVYWKTAENVSVHREPSIRMTTDGVRVGYGCNTPRAEEPTRSCLHLVSLWMRARLYSDLTEGLSDLIMESSSHPIFDWDQEAIRITSTCCKSSSVPVLLHLTHLRSFDRKQYLQTVGSTIPLNAISLMLSSTGSQRRHLS